MALVSVAIVSKDDRPLYLKDFRGESDDDIGTDIFDLAAAAGAPSSVEPLPTNSSGIGQSCSIEQQFILHSALDRIEKLTEPNGMGAAWRYGRTGIFLSDAMFVGLLCPVEDVRVYGYITTTKIKIIAAVEDAFLPGQTEQEKAHEVALKNLMIKIHSLYTEYIANPFTNLSANRIESTRFDNGVIANIRAFNRNPALTLR